LTGYQADEKRSEDNKEFHYYIEVLGRVFGEKIKLEFDVGEINVWVFRTFWGGGLFCSVVPVSSDKGGG
jgi:hypothetical protein